MGNNSIKKTITVKLRLELVHYPDNNYVYVNATRNMRYLLLGECQGNLASVIRDIRRLAVKVDKSGWVRVAPNMNWSCKTHPCKITPMLELRTWVKGGFHTVRYCLKHGKRRGWRRGVWLGDMK